jgi:predicted metal-dependent peptidase
MTRHSARASIALRALNESDPAMAALALWSDHRDGTGGAARTSGTTITYGAAFETLPRHEQIGLAAHHILHVALRHTGRMAAMEARFGESFDGEVYNLAADAVVNEALLQAGYGLPRPALTLTGLLEQVAGVAPPAVQALAEWDVDRLYIRLMQDGRGDGHAADRAKAYARQKVFAEDMAPEAARGEPEKAREDALWRQHLARAMEAGRRAGRGIGVLGHRLADIPLAATPWELVLRGLVTRAVMQVPKATWRRPARDWIAMEAEAAASGGPTPAVRPGVQRATEVPRVVVGLDASSSIDEVRLGMFLGEVAGIARRGGAELWVIPFDEEARAAVRLDPAGWRQKLAGLELPRGGGTSFGPVLAAGAALRPSILVILTDLEGEFGIAPRGLPVVWAVPDATGVAPPPFGRVLTLAR